MGKGNEETFQERGSTDGKQTHEKMFHIISRQGNANKNHNELVLHTYQNA